MGRRLGGRNHAVPYDVVYEQNAPVAEQKLYRVVKGVVWLVRTGEDGSAVVVDEVYPGGYFGQETLCAGFYRTEARQMFPDGIVEEVLWPELSRSEQRAVHRDIADRLANNRWPERVLSGKIRERLLSYLTSLAEKGLGKKVGRSTEVFLPRHEDLALVLASTRETITMALGELRRRQLVSVKDANTFVIPVRRSA